MDEKLMNFAIFATELLTMDIREDILKDFRNEKIEPFYMELYPSLLRYAKRVLGPDKEFLAEDCIQDAIYQVYQGRRTFTTPLQMRSFLFTCVHNAIITVFRKQERHDRYLVDHQEIEDSLIDSFLLQETLDRLYAAIDALPDRLHRIFELSFEQGMKNVEIAALLKLSPETVKKQKAKLITTLREAFRNDPLMLFILSVI